MLPLSFAIGTTLEVGMHPADYLPFDQLIALDPDELGLRLLPFLANWPQASSALELGALTKSLEQGYPNQPLGELRLAVREAWAWLNGQGLLLEHPGYHSPNDLRVLSRKAHALAKEQDPARTYKARRLDKPFLHPTIREDVWSLFHRGKFDSAVFEVMKAVEVAVRTRAGMTSRDFGVPLMRKAFDPDKGPLADMELDYPEREGRAALFAGAMACFKNPHSHRKVNLDDPDSAAEMIMLGNLLLRIVDE